HQGQGQRQGNKGGGAGLGQRADRSKHHHRHGGGGARDQVPGRAEQGRNNGGHNGGVKAVFRRQAGDQGIGHPLGQHHDGVGQAGLGVGPQAGRVDQGPPAEKGQQALPA